MASKTEAACARSMQAGGCCHCRATQLPRAAIKRLRQLLHGPYLHFIRQQQLVQAALMMHRTLNLIQHSIESIAVSAKAQTRHLLVPTADLIQ